MENTTSKSFNTSLICQGCNGSRDSSPNDDSESTSEVIVILQSLIAGVGTAANSTVVIVFLNNKKLRGKIPNIFIINQVSLMIILHWIMKCCSCSFAKILSAMRRIYLSPGWYFFHEWIDQNTCLPKLNNVNDNDNKLVDRVKWHAMINLSCSTPLTCHAVRYQKKILQQIWQFHGWQNDSAWTGCVLIHSGLAIVRYF